MSRLPIPLATLDQHVIALGKTGSGKSSKLRVLVEYLLDKGEPGCIIDVKGDWWGLKSSADGKSAGYPVVIFGGKHGDVPLNPRAGAALAELIFTGNRPCVIDLKEFRAADRTQFFIDFAETAFKVTTGKRWLAISEVHNFAFKGKVLSPQAGEMLHWANRLASEGRGLGLTILADSQRPQKVHNDFLDSCETLIACRMIHKASRDAVAEWIDGCADPETGKQVLRGLAGMQRQDAWVWSPEVNFGPKQMAFEMFRTYDSFKPQAVATQKLKGWAEVDLDEVKGKLASVVAEAEANDPAALKRRIRELEARAAKPATAPAPSTAQLKAAEDRGHAAATKEAQQKFGAYTKALRGYLTEVVDKALELPEPVFTLAVQPHTPLPQREPRPTLGKSAAPVQRPASIPERSGDLGTGERKILTVLSQFPEGCTAAKLTLLAGYRYTGSFRNYLGSLRSAGFLIGDNGGVMQITDAGIAQGPFTDIPRGDLQYWLSHPSFGTGEQKITRALADAPRGLTAQQLCEATGYAYTGSFRNYLGALRTAGVLVGKNSEVMRLSQELQS